MGTTLLVMAAGLGSRFGGTKQLAEVGPNGEAFLDYAVIDALAAGCDDVTIIVRTEIADDVRAHLRSQHDFADDIRLVMQDEFGPSRAKPWGTAHAVLSAREAVPGDFVVVNADDYYGQSSYQLAVDALQGGDDKTAALVAFELAKTLPTEGAVSRGVCEVEGGLLQAIVETHGIQRNPDGSIASDDPAGTHADSTMVSMNMFAFPTVLFEHLDAQWHEFYAANSEEPKAEYLLPDVVDRLRKTGELRVEVPVSSEQWIGVTNPHDLEPAIEALATSRNR